MKVAVIFGTRPEAIKLAPVILALRRRAALRCEVTVTAQHRDLLDQVLPVFGLKPDADLDLMRPDQTLADLTSRALQSLQRYLAASRPDLVLVQGDTTTVFCATLAAFYERIPVGHVEAGLRTGDLDAPWPEEANRVLTSRLARLHFCPTPAARDHLLREAIPADRIWVTGNTVVDALHLALARVQAEAPLIPGLPGELQPGARPGLTRPPCVLITAHRRENFGAPLTALCLALQRLARQFPDAHFVYPVHPNPNVRKTVREHFGAGQLAGASPGAADPFGNVHLLEPLAYLPFVALMDRADLILTDSGGIQEEAPSLGKTVLVLRDKTERPEALAMGCVHVIGLDQERLVEAVARHLPSAALRAAARGAGAANPVNPFGDGAAAERIADLCAAFLNRSERPPTS